jgi:peroxiredoxin Q/BCP
LQAFQADLAEFERRNAQVLGVSSDTLETHRKFAKRYGITFPLISDTEGAVMNLFGGQTRITFIIDRTGIVRYAEPGLPDNEELLERLDAIGEKRP